MPSHPTEECCWFIFKLCVESDDCRYLRGQTSPTILPISTRSVFPPAARFYHFKLKLNNTAAPLLKIIQCFLISEAKSLPGPMKTYMVWTPAAPTSLPCHSSPPPLQPHSSSAVPALLLNLQSLLPWLSPSLPRFTGVFPFQSFFSNYPIKEVLHDPQSKTASMCRHACMTLSSLMIFHFSFIMLNIS